MAPKLYMTDDINKFLWMLDSASTSHMCKNRDLFYQIRRTEQKVWNGNKSTMEANGIGAVRMISEVCGNEHKITLQDVLYVPQLIHILFRMEKCRSVGYRITIDNDRNECGLVEVIQERDFLIKLVAEELS